MVVDSNRLVLGDRNPMSFVDFVSKCLMFALFTYVEALCCKPMNVSSKKCNIYHENLIAYV